MSLISRWTSSLTRTVRLLTTKDGWMIAGGGWRRIQPEFRDPQPAASKRRPNLLDLEAFDDVAGLVAVEFIELDAALEAGAHFVRVVLEALERANLSFVHDFLAAAQARGGIAIDFALRDEAAGDK